MLYGWPGGAKKSKGLRWELATIEECDRFYSESRGEKLMELNELTKKISVTQATMQSRLHAGSAEPMRLYVQAYCDGLDWVIATIKKAIDAERMRQRLARLESELEQEMEPDLPELPDGFAEDTTIAEETENHERVTGLRPL